MSVELLVPTLGESVVEATVSKWIKKIGDPISIDEPIVELETEKVTLEVPSPVDGILSEISFDEGSSVEVGAVLGIIDEGEKTKDRVEISSDKSSDVDNIIDKKEIVSPLPEKNKSSALSPAVNRLVNENKIDPNQVHGSGKDGRITKGDVIDFLDKDNISNNQPVVSNAQQIDEVLEERVPMSRLRRVIASRLKEAQNTAAMLTTFNEVDMSNVISLRNEYKEIFEKTHNIRLGFMGFFIKASIAALKDFPAVNAEIRDNDIIYKKYNNIGVAVGTPQGLVVPVIKNAQNLSLSELEKLITDFGLRARDGKIGIDELSGGTFTISNGGVYGSLMSTPILNPPQSGILGMHKIQKRPVAIDDRVEVRPMMYLAFSYDHRIIDGKEAVSFLVKIKEIIEDPRRIILEI